MDLLIYNKHHWYDETTQKRRDELETERPGKFNGRLMKGDIVEKRPDGFFYDKGYNKNAFAVVHVPDAHGHNYLTAPDMQTSAEYPFGRKRRYSVDIDSLSLSINKDIIVADLTVAKITDKSTNGIVK